MIELNHIHLQRMRGAIEAHNAGGNVQFRINSSEPPTIVWYTVARPRVQHALLNAEKSVVSAWLVLVKAEFARLTAVKPKRGRPPKAKAAPQAESGAGFPAPCPESPGLVN